MIPGIRAAELEAHFRTSGWDVIELKYGHRLRAAFEQPGGTHLRQRIDEMPNEAYQALYGASPEDVRAALLEPFAGDDLSSLEHLLDETGDVDALVRDLGGHDLDDVLAALRRARETTDRPSVIFAYTIKGYGLEIAGRPQNHSALLTGDQLASFRSEVGLTPETEWDGFPAGSPEAELLEAACRAPRPRRPSAGADVRRAGIAHRARSVGPALDPGGLWPRPPRASRASRTSASGS